MVSAPFIRLRPKSVEKLVLRDSIIGNTCTVTHLQTLELRMLERSRMAIFDLWHNVVAEAHCA